jgi:hypothetical protein
MLYFFFVLLSKNVLLSIYIEALAGGPTGINLGKIQEVEAKQL